MEAQIYRECVRYYPFVLGAQPVRPIDLAAFYAAIANEGVRPAPHVIEVDRAQRPDRLSPRSEAGGRDRLGRPRRLLPAQDHAAGRAGARHRALDRAASRLTSPARPAPPTTRTTPGSSASPTTSRWRSGSATTMPTASAARSAAAPTGGQRRGADLRADHPGGVGARCAEGRAGAAVAGGQARSCCVRSIDLESGERHQQAGDRRPRRPAVHRMLPPRPDRADCSTPSISWCRAKSAYGDRDQRYDWRRIRSRLLRLPLPVATATTTSAATMATTRTARGAIFRRRAIARAVRAGAAVRPRSACPAAAGAIRMDASTAEAAASRSELLLGPSAILKDIHDAQP